MKKFSIIFLSMLLVLLIGQATFAKGNIGLTIGYNGEKVAWDYKDDYIDIYSIRGLKIDLSGNYYLTDEFSLSGGLSIIKGIYSYECGYFSGYSEACKAMGLRFNLFGKCDMYKWDIANIGVQAGTMTDMYWVNYPQDANNNLTLFVALGAYGHINVMPGLNAYADLKFPIGFWSKWAHEDDMGLFKIFLYDITLGATYEISPNINLGIEGNISNTSIMGAGIVLEKKANNNDNLKIKYSNFSIGAKVGFSF